MINIIIPLVSIFMMLSSQDRKDVRDEEVVENSIVVKKLDIIADSKISDILNDVFSECDPSETDRVFSLHLTDYKSGIRVYIVKEHVNRIDRINFQDVIGYVIVGKDTVVVTGKHIHDFRYSKDPQPLRLPVQDLIRNDSPEWIYFINDDIFARDGESMGWLWHIPNEELRNYNLTKYSITAPTRTKK